METAQTMVVQPLGMEQDKVVAVIIILITFSAHLLRTIFVHLCKVTIMVVITIINIVDLPLRDMANQSVAIKVMLTKVVIRIEDTTQIGIISPLHLASQSKHLLQVSYVREWCVSVIRHQLQPMLQRALLGLMEQPFIMNVLEMG